jgi:hypothetical protein
LDELGSYAWIDSLDESWCELKYPGSDILLCIIRERRGGWVEVAGMGRQNVRACIVCKCGQLLGNIPPEFFEVL